MTNEWTKDEIMLTRRAWRMKEHYDYERKMMRITLGLWATALVVTAVAVWVLL